MKTISTLVLLLTMYWATGCKPSVDYGYEDHYVFANQTGHSFTFSNYTIHDWNEATSRLNPGQDTTLIEVFANTSKRSKDFILHSPLPMASDSVVIQFDDGKKLVYKRDYTTGNGFEDRSVYNIENYKSTIAGGIYTWHYTFGPQDYQLAK
ncbi:hypothetical protein [Siphonobacter sp. SORGH_AS_1065]|uniref:hypothetical protein n=1 Tax=Siphonobacter sp. SORGH_AS_1065 TaxID=3041795 RepID=UPI002781824A|nr:hypothetical protein [Siphonobacter sp. SORGH_AS_1065]MDQ1090574.1 hypothetical protein [Siphonobacter sp. SORGH_AS_1065]